MTLVNGPEILPIWVKVAKISKIKFPDSRFKFELLKILFKMTNHCISFPIYVVIILEILLRF